MGWRGWWRDLRSRAIGPAPLTATAEFREGESERDAVARVFHEHFAERLRAPRNRVVHQAYDPTPRTDGWPPDLTPGHWHVLSFGRTPHGVIRLVGPLLVTLNRVGSQWSVEVSRARPGCMLCAADNITVMDLPSDVF